MEEENQLEILKSRNTELEEQLKVCREDLRKKDEHITALSSMEIKRSSSQASDSIESRAELASLQVKLESANSKLEEQLEAARIREANMEQLRSDRQSLTAIVEQLQVEKNLSIAEILDAKAASEELRAANSRSELAITTYQNQLRAATDKIAALELELQEMQRDKGHRERTQLSLVQRVEVFYKDLTQYLLLEEDCEPNVVFDKIKSLTGENNSLKGELENVKAISNERESKYLENRETMRKLMQNVDKDKGDFEEYIRLKREMAFELEKVTLEKKTADLKIIELEKRIAELEGSLKEAKRVLDERDGQVSKLDFEKREHVYNIRNVNRDFDTFKDSLAGILGSPVDHCSSTDECIKERVKKLVAENKEKDHTIRQLEERLNNVSTQYERNYENAKESGLKARRIELEYLDLKDRIRQLEKELTNRDVSRDELRAEKERFYHFLRRLAGILKMDPYSTEHDLRLICDGILDRATQMVRNENDKNVDTNHTVVALKKRVRDLKDQLHSRDLHLELMRKKVANQDSHIRETLEDAHQRHLACEDEEELKQKLSKMQRKIESLRDENKALKSELFDSADIKVAFENQTRELDALKHNLNKLERVRQKQAEKISDLSKNVEICDAETNQAKLVSENAVQSLASELRTMRGALERAKRSELELLDFRAVVGRILGLSVDDLAIPNYEIIRRLEKLMSTPQSGITVAVPVQHYPIRHGYEDSGRLLGRRRKSPLRTVYPDSSRPRSVSPVHDVRDGRKY